MVSLHLLTKNLKNQKVNLKNEKVAVVEPGTYVARPLRQMYPQQAFEWNALKKLLFKQHHRLVFLAIDRNVFGMT